MSELASRFFFLFTYNSARIFLDALVVEHKKNCEKFFFVFRIFLIFLKMNEKSRETFDIPFLLLPFR